MKQFLLGCVKNLFALTLILSAPPLEAQDFQSGDIIFQSSPAAQSRAIELATHSPYSHVGVVFEEDGKYWVYEAVQPVGRRPLELWIRHGRSGSYVVKRLKNARAVLSAEKTDRLKAQIQPWLGKDYDAYFGWSDDRLYCSELVWKAYERALGIQLGEMQRLGNFDLSAPEVKAKLAERYGDKIPLDERMISPAAIFDSPLLETVASR